MAKAIKQYTTISHCLINGGVSSGGVSTPPPITAASGTLEDSPISFPYGEEHIDIRNVVLLLDFLLKRHGYSNDLLYTEHGSLLEDIKVLERDENINTLINGDT